MQQIMTLDQHGKSASSPSELALNILNRSTVFSPANLPQDTVRLAKHCMLDWLGVTIAAARDPLIDTLIEAADIGPGGSTLVGRSERTRVFDALLINGTAGHLLDYDDVHSIIPGHVTVAVAPLVFTLGEAHGRSGPDLIASFLAGFEAMCGLAKLTGPGHAMAGFHPTATFGAFGAAVTACHLLGATPQQTVSAVSNVSTQAAGLRGAFGTPLKSIQVGRASVNGYLSASLAMSGVDAGASAFSGRDGFLATHAATPSESALPARGYFLRDVIFKFDASCFITHAPIACMRRLSDAFDMSFENVRRIRIRVHPSAEKICAIPHPTSGLEAKFSVQHVIAMTLSGLNTQDVNAFEDQEAFVRLRPWRDKVELLFDPLTPAPQCAAEIVFADGSTAQTTHNSEVPNDDLDDQEKKLAAKFDALVSPVLGLKAAADLLDGVLRLEQMRDCTSIFARCRSATQFAT